MEQDDIPFILKKLGQTVEKKVSDAIGGKEKGDGKTERTPMPPMRGDGMDFMEPDWEEIDRKADLIVARYAVVSAAMNILPMPFDVMGVTGTFSKMATELAGVYQVIVSNKRARQMGWAIASTTGSVMGLAYAGSRLAKFIPGGYWIATAAQAPVVGAVAWAAGDALKNYFKQCRMGQEPSIASLTESFRSTLRLRLSKAKVSKTADVATVASPAPAAAPKNGTAAPAAPSPATVSVGDVVAQISSLHELVRAGAITQEEFDRKKAELLSRI